MHQRERDVRVETERGLHAAREKICGRIQQRTGGVAERHRAEEQALWRVIRQGRIDEADRVLSQIEDEISEHGAKPLPPDQVSELFAQTFTLA